MRREEGRKVAQLQSMVDAHVVVPQHNRQLPELVLQRSDSGRVSGFTTDCQDGSMPWNALLWPGFVVSQSLHVAVGYTLGPERGYQVKTSRSTYIYIYI